MKTPSVVNEVAVSNLGQPREIGKDVSSKSGYFHVHVSEVLREKYNNLLKPSALAQAVQNESVKDLPQGYALLVKLYKDHSFMNKVRWQGDDAINDYLYDKHPDIIDYLRVNKLRITAEIVGTRPGEELVALEAASARVEASASARSEARACTEQRSTAVATSRSTNDYRTDVSPRASIAYKSETVACYKTKGSGINNHNFIIWSRKPAKV